MACSPEAVPRCVRKIAGHWKPAYICSPNCGRLIRSIGHSNYSALRRSTFGPLAARMPDVS